MPSVSKKQQKFMGIVRSIQKGEQPAGKFSKDAQKAAKKMKKSSVKKYAKTKHDDLPIKKEERDYKDEYKKFQSSTKAKKYRAELNKYNRQKGTYGNGDGKDASHKGGKIVGFESQSKNRGRAEKSRLKKESRNKELTEKDLMNFLMKRFKFNKKKAIDTMKKAGFDTSMLKKEDIRQEIEEYVDGILDGMGEEFMVNEEKECMCEACQKGYMTHPTRKTKVMFGKRYRNCIKKEGNVEEGKYSKIMKAVRKGPKSGPWQIIVSKNNKVVKEVPVKTLQLIPAHYDDIKKAYPNHKIGIEAKDGKIVYREWVVNIKEGTCGYGIDGQLGDVPAGPHLLKKKKKKKDEVSLGGRMSKKISKHKGTRNSADAKKVEKLLLKYGNSKKDVADMMKKYDYVSKTYRRATPAKKAEILSYLQESVNEGGMELKKLEDAIKMFQKKIEKQGRVTNARDEDHLKNLIKIYKQMGGKKIKESVNERMDKRQAGEMLKQLGGNKFIAMTGAKNFAVGPKGASFKIGRNSKNVNYVRIDLKNDLYDMEFIQMRAGKMKVKSKVKQIYADQLQQMFTKHTGMYTSL
jgi:hypothetical protein